MNEIKLLDVVALLEDVEGRFEDAKPDDAAGVLRRGEMGTVVEVFEETAHRPGAFLVEFADRNGVAYAFVALRAEQILKLHNRETGREAA